MGSPALVVLISTVTGGFVPLQPEQKRLMSTFDTVPLMPGVKVWRGHVPAARLTTERRARRDRRMSDRRDRATVVRVERRVGERRCGVDRRVTAHVARPVTAERIVALPHRSAAGTI